MDYKTYTLTITDNETGEVELEGTLAAPRQEHELIPASSIAGMLIKAGAQLDPEMMMVAVRDVIEHKAEALTTNEPPEAFPADAAKGLEQ